MTAAALLARLHESGAEVHVDGLDLVVRATLGRLSAADLEELRHRKPVLLRVLTADLCLLCEGEIDWRRPHAVAFADGTAAHISCYEEAEVARLLEAGRRAVKCPDADPAEVMLKGELT